MKHHWTLQLSVMDYDRFGAHDEIGTATIDVQHLVFGVAKRQWLTLSDPNPEPGIISKPHGRIFVDVCLNVEYNSPELFSEWRAHTDMILNLDLTKPSETTDGSQYPLVVSASRDHKIKVWTMAGQLIGVLGLHKWDHYSIREAQNTGATKIAELLLAKEETQNELNALGEKLHRVALETHREFDSRRDEFAAKREEREQKLANNRAQQEYVKRLETSADVTDRIKAVSTKMGIPAETYNVLSQPVLDDILQRKGKDKEEKETVFSRMRIAGQSKRSYTIKHRAVHTWNFDHLKKIGVFTKETVEYGVVNVDKVLWQNEHSGHPEAIVQKPSNSVAAIYQSQLPDRDLERVLSPDPAQRSKSPNPEASGGLGGHVPKGGATARGTAVNGTIAAFNPIDDHQRKEKRRGRRIGVLDAQGFSENLTKLLNSSMPPHRPAGSWHICIYLYI